MSRTAFFVFFVVVVLKHLILVHVFKIYFGLHVLRVCVCVHEMRLDESMWGL